MGKRLTFFKRFHWRFFHTDVSIRAEHHSIHYIFYHYAASHNCNSKLEEMQKDGEDGRKKIAAITRYVTVALALIESTAMAVGFGRQGLLC